MIMRRLLSQTLLTCMLVLGSLPALAQLPDFVALTEKNSPSVVNISTTRTIKPGTQQMFQFQGPNADEFNDMLQRFMGPSMQNMPEYNAESLGSGFIVSSDGYIVTNNHVIREADTIVVRLSDGSDFTAKVIGADESSDVALIKIDVNRELPTVVFGSSDDLKVGEWVLAIGSPFGFDHSVTQGIVSAKGRGLATEKYVPFIQTDVAINPGSSGGPLLNLNGEVVGMNAQILTRTGGYVGLSFAIPSKVIQDVILQLKAGGKVKRGWLGVAFQTMNKELAQTFGLEQPKGALVAEVMPDSPAAKAGLKTGDVILTYGSQTVDSASDLPHRVGATKPGDTVVLGIMRDKKRMDVPVTIALLKNDDVQDVVEGADADKPANKLGMNVRELTAEERTQAGVSGVLITGVQTSSDAFKAGLRAGDLVIMMGSTPVSTAADVNKVIDGIKPGQTLPLLMSRRGVGQRYIAVTYTSK